MTRVHIEFKRVQTWLFAVPRLRPMVGANALLGQVLRYDLPRLACKYGTQTEDVPSDDSKWKLRKLKTPEVFSAAIASDPLASYDNPQADAKRGIVSRDGGHFEADFAFGAERFAEAAAALMREQLPGLRFNIEINREKQITLPQADLSHELPVLTPCEWSGRGVASANIEKSGDLISVSLDVEHRYKTSMRLDALRRRNHDEKLEQLDLASLLVTQSSLANYKRPSEFNELAGPGYLALIHADGNGVGSALGSTDGEVSYASEEEKQHAQDRKRANFFHQTRVRLRRALKVAFDTHAPALEDSDSQVLAPFIPLMLGGDDLLLVCQADKALPFLHTLCEVLAQQQANDAGFKLTLGIGVVFAKPNIPIHRLHDIAEELAASAKRRYRGAIEQGHEGESVIDWAVYSTSWVTEPTEMRKRDWVKRDEQSTRILSKRPFAVLGDTLDSLGGLLQGIEVLKKVPRSQLRYLLDQLPTGKALAELAFEELVAPVKEGLKALGCEQAWEKVEANTYITSLLDLIEVLEIGRLGTKLPKAEPSEGGLHV